ncbi:Beta-carotene hydroxylase 2, chloroplastic [Sesamum angolense]|uniref:beta-carotene 3-hydroxylase n=1 Tax=Sesamum angolense TaxID=2727404 RepID=A0AAE1X1P7_9LAMI|nr:Beta-carotene hydroxylase 2, chloroplastic [Sesamum angolense]
MSSATMTDAKMEDNGGLRVRNLTVEHQPHIPPSAPTLHSDTCHRTTVHIIAFPITIRQMARTFTDLMRNAILTPNVDQRRPLIGQKEPPHMAAGVYIATPSRTVVHLKHSPLLGPKPTSLAAPTLRLPHSLQKFQGIKRKKPNLTVCFVLEDEKLTRLGSRDLGEESGEESSNNRKEIATAVAVAAGVAEKVARKRSERFTYLVAAVMSSFGITSMSHVYICLANGGRRDTLRRNVWYICSLCWSCCGMEFWARWAHKALWHASLWHMHESHHKPREGPFELNDVFAIINAVPAIALLSYGFFHKGLVPGLCFGAGLGITMFGMAYMFVHDGLVHRRFPVGPIANVPYFRRVAAAHQELKKWEDLRSWRRKLIEGLNCPRI